MGRNSGGAARGGVAAQLLQCVPRPCSVFLHCPCLLRMSLSVFCNKCSAGRAEGRATACCSRRAPCDCAATRRRPPGGTPAGAGFHMARDAACTLHVVCHAVLVTSGTFELHGCCASATGALEATARPRHLRLVLSAVMFLNHLRLALPAAAGLIWALQRLRGGRADHEAAAPAPADQVCSWSCMNAAQAAPCTGARCAASARRRSPPAGAVDRPPLPPARRLTLLPAACFSRMRARRSTWSCPQHPRSCSCPFLSRRR